jgi:hypothetical protein
VASAPYNGQPITARVDAIGRLVEADPMLAELQAEAGSEVGSKLALPQLAAVARLVRKLGISVSRPVVVAARDHDVEMWVRAEPDGEDVLLTIEKWKNRPPAPSRLEVAAGDDDLIGNAIRNGWATDAELRFTSLSPDLAQLLGVDAAEAVGQPLTRFLRLEEGEDGAMPLLSALAARAAFAGQPAAARGNGNQRLVLGGDPVQAMTAVSPASAAARPPIMCRSRRLPTSPGARPRSTRRSTRHCALRWHGSSKLLKALSTAPTGH